MIGGIACGCRNRGGRCKSIAKSAGLPGLRAYVIEYDPFALLLMRVALPCGGRLINASSNHVVSDPPARPDGRHFTEHPLAVPPQNRVAVYYCYTTYNTLVISGNCLGERKFSQPMQESREQGPRTPIGGRVKERSVFPVQILPPSCYKLRTVLNCSENERLHSPCGPDTDGECTCRSGLESLDQD